MTGEISIHQAQAALKQNPGIRLVDVRTPQEYAGGCIAGSINVPLDTLSQFTRVVQNKQAKIFVYCRSGVRAIQAKESLAAMGYTDVTSLGGIRGWALVKPQ